MDKIRITLFASPMGHDSDRISRLVVKWLKETNAFDITVAGTYPKNDCTIEAYMLDEARVAKTDLFFLLCSDEQWQDPRVRRNLENAVKKGAGVLSFHGVHPYFRDWPEAEKMVGLLWRDNTSHGDFNYCDVKMTAVEHPITEGVAPFRTKEELYCGLQNVQNMNLQVLVTGYSDPAQVSRWGRPGTGKDEPLLTVGNYGSGRTLNFILGHVWPFYTGHGLLENTMIAFEPPQVKTLLLRSCEWAATGRVEKTLGF